MNPHSTKTQRKARKAIEFLKKDSGLIIRFEQETNNSTNNSTTTLNCRVIGVVLAHTEKFWRATMKEHLKRCPRIIQNEMDRIEKAQKAKEAKERENLDYMTWLMDTRDTSYQCDVHSRLVPCH